MSKIIWLLDMSLRAEALTTRGHAGRSIRIVKYLGGLGFVR